MKKLQNTIVIQSKRDGHAHHFEYTWESVTGIEDSHIDMIHRCSKAYITAVENLFDTKGGLLPRYNAPLDYVGTFEKII